MEANTRKAKLYFDTAAHPAHVTFDDGKFIQRNFAWLHYAEARRTYAELDVIHIEIGECVVVIVGNNIEPLFTAIEEQTLVRVRAMPHFSDKPEHDIDTYVTAIRFVAQPKNPHAPLSGGNAAHRPEQGMFDLS